MKRPPSRCTVKSQCIQDKDLETEVLNPGYISELPGNFPEILMFGLHSRPIISKSLILGFGQSLQTILQGARVENHCPKIAQKKKRRETRREKDFEIS